MSWSCGIPPVCCGHLVSVADVGAGQEDYDRLRPLSYRDAHMVFIFYSVVDPDSFRAVETKVRVISLCTVSAHTIRV